MSSQEFASQATPLPSSPQSYPAPPSPLSTHSEPQSQPSSLPPPALLPPPFTNTLPPPLPIHLGAESHLLRTHFLSSTLPAALKFRPVKKWRHPTLDARLTKQRVLAEARVLVKLRRERIRVPAVYCMDMGEGNRGEGEGRGLGAWLLMEWIEGRSVRRLLGDVTALQQQQEQESEREGEDGDIEEKVRALLGRVGEAIGKMHATGVVHGDLTTSNVMVRPLSSSSPSTSTLLRHGEVVLIDFGLATQSVQDEDRAVDLYVLERAFGSTHPKQEGMFAGEVLNGYRMGLGREKDWKTVKRRLEDVRLRGRKRSMVG